MPEKAEKVVRPPQNVIAIVFDFDGTLTDDTSTRLLEAHDIDKEEFWKEHAGRVKTGWDPTLCYLQMLLDNVGKGKPLGQLTNGELKEFGESLEFYEGIPRIFSALKGIAARHEISHPVVEFYVLSGGLEEIIRGSRIAKYFTAIRGCTFDTGANGVIRVVKRVVSFTEKTRYIFEINKGVIPVDKSNNPYAVNREVPPEMRRVPMDRMIYVGDGLTDIPCFSLIQNNSGKAVGVYDPKKTDEPRRTYTELVAPKRVSEIFEPDYRAGKPLGEALRTLVELKCMEMDISPYMALVR